VGDLVEVVGEPTAEVPVIVGSCRRQSRGGVAASDDVE
jgi:hypothetical protein